MPKVKDMKGMTFNELRVISYEGIRNHNAQWLCECLLCSKKTVVSRPNLISGNTKDCGCRKSEKIRDKIKTHGMTNSGSHKTWLSMRKRIREGEKHSKVYGAISICKEWEESFESFFKDMGERPKGKTLDRIDNTKGYCKENCRWATQKEQSNNRSTNVLLTYKGLTMTQSEWAKYLGINRNTITRRRKRGLPIEKILSTTRV